MPAHVHRRQDQPIADPTTSRRSKTKVPLEAGAQRLIIATCEKGTVENIEEMRGIKGNLDKIKKANPNFVEIAAKAVFRVPDVPLVADPLPKFQITAAQKKRAALMKKRAEIRIGMPRVLNMYSQTPIFTGYFAVAGHQGREHRLLATTPARSCTRKAPSAAPSTRASRRKLGIPHVHNLLYKVHAEEAARHHLLPDDRLPDQPICSNVQASRACPTVATTPEAVKAAFIKEGDLFKEKGVRFLDTFVNLSKPDLLRAADVRGVQGHPRPRRRKRTSAPSSRAIARCDHFDNVTMRGAAREVLEQLEREDRLGVVLLGRPYHNDPGVNHEILEEFQKLGYPVFAQDCLPIDDDIIWRLFGDEVVAGEIAASAGDRRRLEELATARTPAARSGPPSTSRGIRTWWRWSFPASSAATTRPIYTVVEEIVEHSGTPYFCFKDIDENKPTGSIKIRVETIGYFLKRYREDMVRNKKQGSTIDEQLKEFEDQLRHELQLAGSSSHRGNSCGTHESVPSELIGIQPAQNELVELSGD